MNQMEKKEIVLTKHLLFSNPLLDFIKYFKNEVPNKVLEASNNLDYRNHISVHVTIDKKLFDDNWIYIHSPDLKMARIADFTNFSKDMSIEGNYPITLEYFALKMRRFGMTPMKILLLLP